LYPGGRARLIPRRTSVNASRRSAGSAARYSVTVDAGMGQIYRNGFDGATVISEARVLAKPTNPPSSQFRRSFMYRRLTPYIGVRWFALNGAMSSNAKQEPRAKA
jgi:hypothetical protein